MLLFTTINLYPHWKWIVVYNECHSSSDKPVISVIPVIRRISFNNVFVHMLT